MSNKFYSLEETASIMNKSVDEVQAMADNGELTSFRDGDQVMFKAVDIDALAGDDIAYSGDITIDLDDMKLEDGNKSGSSGFGSGFGAPGQNVNFFEGDGVDEDEGAATRIIGSSADTVGGETFELSGETGVSPGSGAGTGSDLMGLNETGVEHINEGDIGASVFDSNEVAESDPSAHTRITASDASFSGADFGGDDDDDLVLEAVGSGSGLLDLTRESDDTSLGAELLEEIYPSGATGVTGAQSGFGTGVGMGSEFSASMTPSGLAGMFDESMSGAGASMYGTGEDQASGAMGSDQSEIMVESAGGGVITVPYEPDKVNLPTSLMVMGFLLPASVGLVLATIIVVNLILVPMRNIPLLTTMQENFELILGGIGAFSLILGVGGYIVGRTMNK